MTIPLQTSIVYGPVDSRRFGRSLGINFLPTDRRLCNFNCVYCQYGPAKATGAAVFPSLQRICEEARLRFLLEAGSKVDWIMISGNGEPTLHPEFPQAVEALVALRDEFLPGVPIGILSNSSTCSRPAVRASLRRLDGCFLKLDAADAALFQRVNRPTNGKNVKKVVESLSGMPNIVIQSMFVRGRGNNTTTPAVRQWIRALGSIRPESVQIYTIDRPTADRRVRAVSNAKLNAIANRLKKATGIRPAVFIA